MLSRRLLCESCPRLRGAHAADPYRCAHGHPSLSRGHLEGIGIGGCEVKRTGFVGFVSSFVPMPIVCGYHQTTKFSPKYLPSDRQVLLLINKNMQKGKQPTQTKQNKQACGAAWPRHPGLSVASSGTKSSSSQPGNAPCGRWRRSGERSRRGLSHVGGIVHQAFC